MAESIQNDIIKPLLEFSTDSKQFLTKCEKPTFDEFTKVGVSTAVGFSIIGFIGFLVKLIFIPINNIIIGQ